MAASIWLITYQRTIEIHAYVGRPRLTKRFCIAISNSFLGTTLLPPVSKITRIPAADFDEGRGAKNAEPYSRRTEGPSSERGREYILEIHHNTREHRAGNQQKSNGNFAPPVFMPGIPSQQSMLEAVDKLKFFLATAPTSFDTSPYDQQDPVSGTDIVRALHFRFAAFGRPVRNAKKFEEGIFSDLRNLKSGSDATLEEPKSDFLELLFKYNCIRTQKKQKVFYWFSVPHDRLFLDALDRDLKREKLGVEPTTEAVAEPALSFVYNPNK
ncbi:hypothetical protein PCANC_27266, partial [Puccinia coronata f. sp. avenae]